MDLEAAPGLRVTAPLWLHSEAEGPFFLKHFFPRDPLFPPQNERMPSSSDSAHHQPCTACIEWVGGTGRTHPVRSSLLFSFVLNVSVPQFSLFWRHCPEERLQRLNLRVWELNLGFPAPSFFLQGSPRFLCNATSSGWRWHPS